MRKILLSVLVGLSCLTSFAQTTTPRIGTVYETIRSVYPGNEDVLTVTIDRADSAKLVTVNTYYVTGGIALSSAQPVVTRAGLSVVVRFPNVSVIPTQARVKLKIADAVRQVWRYDVSESNTTKTNPSSLTITNSIIGVDQTTYSQDKAGLVQSIAQKAPQSAVDQANQAIADRYTKSEIDAKKPDFTSVATFSAAKALITPGVAKTFRIANNEKFNCPTQSPCPTASTYDGANWYHSPALLINN